MDVVHIERINNWNRWKAIDEFLIRAGIDESVSFDLASRYADTSQCMRHILTDAHRRTRQKQLEEEVTLFDWHSSDGDVEGEIIYAVPPKLQAALDKNRTNKERQALWRVREKLRKEWTRPLSTKMG